MAPIRWTPNFGEVLTWLHSQLGAPLRVEVGLTDSFAAVSFTAPLERVCSIEPASNAVMIHFAGDQVLDLDPDEMRMLAFLEGEELRFELWLDSGLLVELAREADD